MQTKIKQNERSWAIDIISYLNSILSSSDLKIKNVGGEATISQGKTCRMFPDVILYGDKDKTQILQGWELKMPDVDIGNEVFIKDAQRKANSLNLTSCFIWNFTYGVLYIKQKDDTFKKEKEWNETSFIKTRDDVKKYSKEWHILLKNIFISINEYLLKGNYKTSSIGKTISEYTVPHLIVNHIPSVSDKLKEVSFKNQIMKAELEKWWKDIKCEYEEEDVYTAYAKSVILNWTNRFIFAHLIKRVQNAACLVEKINENTLPKDANIIFREISNSSDFYNIFYGIQYCEYVSEDCWTDLIELSHFLSNNGITNLSQSVFQEILESTVKSSKKSLNGQFTTPEVLARILVKITLLDRSQNILDCCCGTGTIAKEAIKLKKECMPPKLAIDTVWASDKSSYALQVANISMTDSDSFKIANRLFKHNALDLTVGEVIPIVDPSSGNIINYSLPEFGAICSNLPFVLFSNLSSDDVKLFSLVNKSDELDRRSDLYCYIALKLISLINDNGRIGIITSNSWLGSQAGIKFYDALNIVYEINQIHISGKEKWFKADVITTILILSKKKNLSNYKTSFFLWKKSLKQISISPSIEDDIVNSSLLNEELNSDVVEISSYTQSEIKELKEKGLSFNSLFYKLDWYFSIKDKLVKIGDLFNVIRGSRRGWDELFFPKDKNGKLNIEAKFLKKVLINSKNIISLRAVADGDAFCCNMTEEELQEQHCIGALSWIDKFRNKVNKKGDPLPKVLIKENCYWYQLLTNEIVDICAPLNPNERIFFARFDVPSFINQRLIGLIYKKDVSNKDLCHALLNSIVTLFAVEAAGFGRGQGVLDLSKKSLEQCNMPDPSQIDYISACDIINKFNKIKDKKIPDLKDINKDLERVDFDKAVLKAFGLEQLYETIYCTLLAMHNVRLFSN